MPRSGPPGWNASWASDAGRVRWPERPSGAAAAHGVRRVRQLGPTPGCGRRRLRRREGLRHHGQGHDASTKRCSPAGQNRAGPSSRSPRRTAACRGDELLRQGVCTLQAAIHDQAPPNKGSGATLSANCPPPSFRGSSGSRRSDRPLRVSAATERHERPARARFCSQCGPPCTSALPSLRMNA